MKRVCVAKELKIFKEPFAKAVRIVFMLFKLPDFALPKIAFTIAKNKLALAEMEGVGGYCPSPDFIKISIDPDHPKFKKDPVGTVARSLCHELYHALRFATGVSSPNGSLLDCVIDEGLADQFVFESLGCLPIWNKRLPARKLGSLMKKLKKIYSRKINDQSYSDWFIKGSKNKDIPKWAGYSLGLVLVRSYEKMHGIDSVLKLVKLPAKAFRILQKIK